MTVASVLAIAGRFTVASRDLAVSAVGRSRDSRLVLGTSIFVSSDSLGALATEAVSEAESAVSAGSAKTTDV